MSEFFMAEENGQWIYSVWKLFYESTSGHCVNEEISSFRVSIQIEIFGVIWIVFFDFPVHQTRQQQELPDVDIVNNSKQSQWCWWA